MAGAPGGVWRSTGSNSSSNGDGSTAPKTAAAATSNKKTDANMYEALWCNGPKEVMEFHDYLFTDHFGNSTELPMYLPRQCVLDYLVQRVTRHCPTFFEQYAHFHTKVDTVTYDATTELFTVHTTTGLNTTNPSSPPPQLFHKVIWSAGQNGAGKIPRAIQKPFQEALDQYQEKESTASYTIPPPTPPPPPPPPPFLHASAVEPSIAARIRDNHLLLIGGSYSAEDLAFMGIKWGARHVTILTRRHGIDVPVCWTSQWPYHCVTVVAGYVPDRVEVLVTTKSSEDPDATAQQQQRASYQVRLKKYAYEMDVQDVYETTSSATASTDPFGNITKKQDDNQPNSQTSVMNWKDPAVDTTSAANTTKAFHDTTDIISNVDVVICCTGYTEHLDMLDKSCYNMTDQEYQTYWNGMDKLKLPEGWTMPANGVSQAMAADGCGAQDELKNNTTVVADNSTTSCTKTKEAHIAPKEGLYPGCYVTPYSYRELLFIHNPNLMWLAANNFDTPLLALDVQACLALRYITGQQPIPSRQEMKDSNYQQAIREMSMPMVRHWMDTNYYNAVRQWLSKTTRKIHYQNNDSGNGTNCVRYEYPAAWVDAYKETSKYELHLLGRLMEEAEYPLQLGSFEKLNENGEAFLKINWGCRNYNTCAAAGTTFRDVTQEQCDQVCSVFNGAKPVPMKGRWLDMDDQISNPCDMV